MICHTQSNDPRTLDRISNSLVDLFERSLFDLIAKFKSKSDKARKILVNGVEKW